MNRFRWDIVSIIAVLSLFVLTACSSGNSAPAASPLAPDAPTSPIQATATPMPAGTPLATPTPTTVPGPDVAFDEPFQIQVGQTVSVGSADLRFTFFEVSEDSRCPSDVVCIWAGQVVVTVALEDGGDDLYSESLIVGNAEAATKKIGDYTVEAMAVDPYPVSTGTIASADYSLTLKVSLK